MTDTDRWALNAKGRQIAPVDILPLIATNPHKIVVVEKSENPEYGRAAFVYLEAKAAHVDMHLSADDAEGMATVLLYLADKWRKENLNE